MLWLAGRPQISGIFNLGTGHARSFVDLARAIGAALNQPVNVEFVDMPESIRANYQYFTEARMAKLAGSGYEHPFFTLETGVADYVQRYLAQADVYR